MLFPMSNDNVIQFLNKKKKYTLTRQYCECGSVLEMWVDDDGVAYGLCTRCHLGVGDELVQINEDINNQDD